MDQTTAKWSMLELSFQGPREGNPFTEVSFCADFIHGEDSQRIGGFYDGDGVFRIRFLPQREGEWHYRTHSSAPALDGLCGAFLCTPPEPGSHGPVGVLDTFHFAYRDGTPFYPFGTTCYAWAHQNAALREQTLCTLGRSGFNKIRMCVFPKSYDYNRAEPECYPFAGSPQEGFDFTRPNPAFYQNLEDCIARLGELGIQADLILFHPYDRWGFATMGRQADMRYLRYLAARLAAFPNIWWAMANEYDLTEKSPGDWEALGSLLQECDPYRHLCSIHNWGKFYDHGRPWITHCSIQRVDFYKTTENTALWRQEYQKPVVVDECAYEGNINHCWGNITPQEMTRRFWEGVLRGGYVSHGETYVHPRDILWWSHGGELHGESPARIAFLRRLVESLPAPLSPAEEPVWSTDYYWDMTCGVIGEEVYLFYFGGYQPAFRVFDLPRGKRYRARLIDTWNMTDEALPGTHEGNFRLELPGRQYMAVLFLHDEA